MLIISWIGVVDNLATPILQDFFHILEGVLSLCPPSPVLPAFSITITQLGSMQISGLMLAEYKNGLHYGSRATSLQ